MSAGRQLPGHDYLALKASARALVKAAGGQVAAAGVTRVRQQELSNYGSVGGELSDRHMPIDVVADLEAEIGAPVVTRVLAELSGHILVPLPRGRGRSPLLRLAGMGAEGMGALVAAVIAAVADGRVSDDEGRCLVAQIHDIMVHLATLAEQVRAEAARHDGKPAAGEGAGA